MKGTPMIKHANPPKSCDCCNTAIGNHFYDCATIYGPWANLCPACFKEIGIGLGVGKGQMYHHLEALGYYIKVDSLS